jgi:hypothetical protein
LEPAKRTSSSRDGSNEPVACEVDSGLCKIVSRRGDVVSAFCEDG